MKFDIKTQILLYVFGIGIILFMLWQLSVSIGIIQTVFLIIGLVATGFLFDLLFRKKSFGKDDFIIAEEYAKKYVEKLTGAKSTYLDGEGSTKTYEDTDFFAFKINRADPPRFMQPFLVIIKKKLGGFKIHYKSENPRPYILDDIFGKDSTWSVLTGKPEFAVLKGAPVPVKEYMFHPYKKPPSTQVVVGSKILDESEKETAEKKKAGLSE